MEKPNIPTTQQILEDIFDPEIVQVRDHSAKTLDGNEMLVTAHSCFKNFKQLQEDLEIHAGLQKQLDEVHKKLIKNVVNMKKQT